MGIGDHADAGFDCSRRASLFCHGCLKLCGGLVVRLVVCLGF